MSYTLELELTNIVKKRKFKVDNYILVTNIPLTSTFKDNLCVTFAGKHDFNFFIIDGTDICNFLDNLVSIRRSFPQLLGLSDLDHIVNREHYVRAEAFLKDWQPKLAVFARTNAYDRAMKTLHSSYFVVLDGPPEVGKSTIAAAMSLHFLAEGYEVIDLREPSDFHSCFDRMKKQIFVADDAVGSISFDPGLGDSWSRDLPGILRCLDSEHKLIWTARKYILEEAIQKTKISDLIDNFPKPHEVVVEVLGYSPKEKVMILYNHAKNVTLNDEIRQVVREIGKALISDDNFTPERVRQLFTQILPQLEKEHHKKEDCLAEIKAFFKDPSRRWIKAYKTLSDCEKEMLFTIFDLNSKTSIEKLKVNYENRSRTLTDSLSFNECLSRLESSFLKKTKTYSGKEEIDFQHPSLRDLLLKTLNENPAMRLYYINLTSVNGIIGILTGIGSSDTHHTFRMKDVREIEAFARRISLLNINRVSSSDWITILSILRSLMIKTPSFVPKPIVNSILTTATDFKMLETNNWSNFSWCKFLDMLYPLLSLVEMSPRVSYIEQLSSRFLSANHQDGLSFVCILNDWEPIINKRKVWHEKYLGWIEELEDVIKSQIEDGNVDSKIMAASDYDDWYSGFESIDNLIKRLEESEMLSDEVNVLHFDLAKIKDELEPQEDYYDDDDDYRGSRIDEAEYWSIDRIIEDI